MLLSNALRREESVLKRSLEKTTEQLFLFEKKYAMTSEEFFQRYQNGIMNDSDDMIDWAGEYQIYLSLKEQVESLGELEVCS